MTTITLAPPPYPLIIHAHTQLLTLFLNTEIKLEVLKDGTGYSRHVCGGSGGAEGQVLTLSWIRETEKYVFMGFTLGMQRFRQKTTIAVFKHRKCLTLKEPLGDLVIG